MKIFFFILSVFIFQKAICQVEPVKDENYYKKVIEKNIFRGTLTLLLHTELTAAICYEREIAKPFTLVFKAGPSVFVDDISSESETEFALRASGELRYYFNLRKRIKREKATRNFSAGYFSLEPFVISKSLVLFDDPDHQERNATIGIYLNIGFQKQVKRSYIAAFSGIWFGAKGDGVSDVFDIIQAGFVIGRVF